MDDLAKKLGDLLNSPDSMQKIQSMMAALGASADESEKSSAPSQDALGSLLSSLNGKSEKSSNTSEDSLAALLASFTGKSDPTPSSTALSTATSANSDFPDLSMITKLAPLLSSMGKEDNNTTLLKALRPYLHGDREKRLDDAIQIMKFVRLMPLLQNKGLF